MEHCTKHATHFSPFLKRIKMKHHTYTTQLHPLPKKKKTPHRFNHVHSHLDLVYRLALGRHPCLFDTRAPLENQTLRHKIAFVKLCMCLQNSKNVHKCGGNNCKAGLNLTVRQNCKEDSENRKPRDAHYRTSE